jgi:hypothetical protein
MRHALLFAVLCCAAACTSLRPVDLDDAAAEASAIAPGDRIRVTKKDGTTIKLQATEVTPAAVEGTTASKQVIRVEAAEIDEVAVRERAPGKTGALVGSLVVLLGLFVEGLEGLPPY